MDERDKIIREDYPVEKLPEDLRAELGGVGRVRVTLEPSDKMADRKCAEWARVEAHIEKARASPGFRPVTNEEAVARIRELRDEWDR